MGIQSPAAGCVGLTTGPDHRLGGLEDSSTGRRQSFPANSVTLTRRGVATAAPAYQHFVRPAAIGVLPGSCKKPSRTRGSSPKRRLAANPTGFRLAEFFCRTVIKAATDFPQVALDLLAPAWQYTRGSTQLARSRHWTTGPERRSVSNRRANCVRAVRPPSPWPSVPT
jgi:hypothetical protein